MKLATYYDYLRSFRVSQEKYRNEGDVYQVQRDPFDTLLVALSTIKETSASVNHRDSRMKEGLQDNRHDNYSMNFDELEFITKISITLSLIKE